MKRTNKALIALVASASLAAIATLAVIKLNFGKPSIQDDELSIDKIKSYRKRKNSKIIVSSARNLIDASKKDNSIDLSKISRLCDKYKGDYIIAEYDADKDKIIQYSFVSKTSRAVSDLLERYDGCVILED